MAELNDKLITYGNLSTFYDKLQEQGLGGNAIEDASVLPDAVENKSKLIRLESDDNVYISELKSRTSTTTNRLPDEQQIDKAYLYEDANYQYHYVGAYTATFSDGEVSGYGWLDYYSEHEWYFYLTEDDAEHIQTNSVCYGSFAYEDSDTIDLVNKTVTTQATKNDYKSTLSDSEKFPIPAIYNAPESAQIGNATLVDGLNLENGLYTGEQITFEDTEHGAVQITGYKWTDLDDSENYCLATDKPASQIYFYYDEDNSVYYTDAKLWIVDLSEYTSETAGFNAIYIPQLNAPDSEQVGHATIDEDYFANRWLYEGNETSITYDNKIVNVYTWQCSTDSHILYTSKQAFEIYNTNKDSDDVQIYALDDDDVIVELTFNNGDLNEISTVKYQRTETTEEWDWLPLTDNATDDDIDAMFATPESPVVKRVLMKANNRGYDMTIKEGLVNVSGETIEYEGQTYYLWAKYEERSGESVQDEVSGADYDGPVYVLTTTLNVTLPFNSSSPEYAYTAVVYPEYDDVSECYASPSSETYPKIALIHEDGSITYEE